MVKFKLYEYQYGFLALFITIPVGIWLYKVANEYLPDMWGLPKFEGYFFYWLSVLLVYSIVIGSLAFINYFIRKKIVRVIDPLGSRDQHS